MRLVEDTATAYAVDVAAPRATVGGPVQVRFTIDLEPGRDNMTFGIRTDEPIVVRDARYVTIRVYRADGFLWESAPIAVDPGGTVAVG